MVKILLKRIYEEPSEADGYRILLDRLWPRGLKKEDAKFDEWRKDITPSKELPSPSLQEVHSMVQR